MPSGPEVGSAYISLVPSAKGFGAKVQTALGPELQGAGVTSGQTFGKGMSTGVTSTTGSLAKSVVGTFAAIGATRFLGSAISEAREAAQVGRLTEAVIKSTGGAAQVSADQVGNLADKLSLMAGVDDDAIQSAENVLLTFTAVQNKAGEGNDIFDQGTTAALNMSAALGQDLQSSIIQVGKALNDPIQGVSALRRVGVQLTDDQEKMVKALVDSGDVLGAQKVILGELTKEFGGAAAAAADPAAKADVAFKNLEETLGTALLPALSELATVFATDIAPTLTVMLQGFSALPGPIQAAGLGLVGLSFAAGPIGKVAKGLGGIFSVSGKAAAGLGRVVLAGGKLIVSMVQLGARLVVAGAQMVAAGVKSAASFAAAMIRAAASAVVAGVQMVASFIATAAAAVVNAAIMVAAWIAAALPFIALGLLIAGVVFLIIEYWDEISAATVAAWSAITDFVTSAVSSIVNGVSTGVSEVVGFFTALPGRILGAVGNLGSLLWGAGAAVINGLLGGIKSAIGALWDFVSSIPGNIVGFFTDRLDIGSPSKVMMVLGADTVTGFALGMRSRVALVRSASAQMIDAVAFTGPTRAFMGAGLPGAVGSGSGGVVVQGPLVHLSGPVSIRDDSDITRLSRSLARDSARELRAQGHNVSALP